MKLKQTLSVPLTAAAVTLCAAGATATDTNEVYRLTMENRRKCQCDRDGMKRQMCTSPRGRVKGMRHVFTFSPKGEFVFLQISDIQEQYKLDPRSEKLIRSAVEKFRPSLAILTGDQTMGCNHRLDFLLTVTNIVSVFTDCKLPFALTMGNHDCEFTGPDRLDGEDLWREYMRLGGEYFVDFDEPELSGIGNGVIPVTDPKTGRPGYNLFVMDSGNYHKYSPNAKLWTFDGPHPDQIKWYAEHAGTAPSLFFMHIPINEMNRTGVYTVSDTRVPGTFRCNGKWVRPNPARSVGEMKNNCDCSGVSWKHNGKALYQYWVESGTVKGAFFGHDHENSFLAKSNDGVFLGYCKSATLCSGNDGNPGLRVFTLHDDGRFETFTYTERDVNAGTVPCDEVQALEAAIRAKTSGTVKTSRPMAEILSRRIVARDSYCGWPTVCLRKNGELLVAYSGLREDHVDPWGTVRIVKSADDGATWSKPWTAQNSFTDDRDSGIWELDDGSLVLTWFHHNMWVDGVDGRKDRSWRRHLDKIRDLLDLKAPWCDWRAFTAKSYDGGRTWTNIVETIGNACHGGIQLKNGRLMMITRKWAGYRRNTVQVEASDDCGLSWFKLADIPLPREANGADHNNYHEAHLAEYPDGRILAVFRYHDFPTFKSDGSRNIGPIFMRQIESRDGGRTWSKSVKTAEGYPPHLLRLRDGRTLLTCGRGRGSPNGQRIYAILSTDDGRTWDEADAFHLAQVPPGDSGYPSTVQLKDGSLCTVFYGPEEKSAPPCIQAVRWRLLKKMEKIVAGGQGKRAL